MLDSPGFSLRPLTFVFAFAVFLFLFALGSRDFWAPVEPRYAEIARIMFLKGQWIVPTINGDIYTDKPILYFWLVLIAAKLFGAVNEWTVRLPAALGGIAFVCGTYLIGRDLLGSRAALIGAVVLGTSMRVLWESRWAHVDMVFCAFFIFAIHFGARTVFHKGNANEVLLSYFFIALATLTKGLIGVVLPGLIFFGYMFVRRDWSMLARMKLYWGIIIFFLIAVPWFYTVNQATGGKWLADFIYIHHVQRYTDGSGHRQPLYYYLTTLPADFLPWTTFLVPAVWAYRPLRSRFTDPLVQFFLVWFVAVFLFFSFSDTKRDLYLLPLLPTLAVFLGRYLDDLIGGRIAQDFLYRWWTSFFFGLVAVSGLCLPAAAWFDYREAFRAVLPASVVLLVTGLASVFYVWRCRPFYTIATTAVMMALTMVCVSVWIVPYLERFKSPRWFSDQVRRIVPAETLVYMYADTMNDFNYYTGREVIPVISTATALDRVLHERRRAYLIIKGRDLKRLPQLSAQWIVVSEGKTSANWHLLEFRPAASQ